MTEETKATEGSEETSPIDEGEQQHEQREQLQQRIAQLLSDARKERGLSAEDIAGSLRLLPVYLRAFDSGDWSKMPEEVYTLGFLRQYADFVGLDLNKEIAQLKSGNYRLNKPFTIPDPPLAPSRKWAILIAGLFLLFFIAFNLTSHDEKAPAPAIDEQETILAPTLADTEEGGTEQQQAPEPAVDGHSYRFSATGEAVWLQVFDSSRKLIREALLQSGESLNIVHAGPALLVTSGNAAALGVEIDGKVVAVAGELGEAGQVLREYRLAPPAGK